MTVAVAARVGRGRVFCSWPPHGLAAGLTIVGFCVCEWVALQASRGVLCIGYPRADLRC